MTYYPNGIAQLPGFVESMRLLIAREQYSATDVALMFDVSRERIRQLIARHAIPVHHYPKGLYASRLWDDANHRFYPVNRHALWLAEQRKPILERKAARQRTYLARWAAAVAVLRELATELGRTPTQKELAERMGWRNLGSLISHLAPNRRTQRHVMRRFYADAGLTVRARGDTGHTKPLKKQTHCKRGHERTPANTYTCKGRSRCRACCLVRHGDRTPETP